MYKLKDGPLDWFFCNDEHALEWLQHRHTSPDTHKLLKMPPTQRANFLSQTGMTLEELISVELSQKKESERDDASSAARSDGDDGYGNVSGV